MDGTSGHVTHCHLPTIPVVKPLDRSADARVVSLRPSPPIETGESTAGYIPTRVNARPVTEARFDHESNDGESRRRHWIQRRNRASRSLREQPGAHERTSPVP